MPPPRGGSHAEFFIQRFDGDNDGKVSDSELPGPDEVFRFLDQDGDGYISLNEAPQGPPGGGPPLGGGRGFGKGAPPMLYDCANQAGP